MNLESNQLNNSNKHIDNLFLKLEQIKNEIASRISSSNLSVESKTKI